MSKLLPQDRSVRLASGHNMPLYEAVLAFAVLQGMCVSEHGDAHLLPVVRSVCITGGKLPQDAALRRLIEIGVAKVDGEVRDNIRAVVLASLRGQDEALHLVSPFVRGDEQRVANILSGWVQLQGSLPPDTPPPPELAPYLPPSEPNTTTPGWANRLRGEDGGFVAPPPSPN
jgi:hypothetical protein